MFISSINPIEQIWEEIREKNFLNEVFANLSKVVDRLCEGTLRLMNDPSTVASITHRAWLMDALKI